MWCLSTCHLNILRIQDLCWWIKIHIHHNRCLLATTRSNICLYNLLVSKLLVFKCIYFAHLIAINMQHICTDLETRNLHACIYNTAILHNLFYRRTAFHGNLKQFNGNLSWRCQLLQTRRFSCRAMERFLLIIAGTNKLLIILQSRLFSRLLLLRWWSILSHVWLSSLLRRQHLFLTIDHSAFAANRGVLVKKSGDFSWGFVVVRYFLF